MIPLGSHTWQSDMQPPCWFFGLLLGTEHGGRAASVAGPVRLDPWLCVFPPFLLHECAVASRPFAYTTCSLIKSRQCCSLLGYYFYLVVVFLCSAIPNVLVLFQNMIKQNEEPFDTALF